MRLVRARRLEGMLEMPRVMGRAMVVAVCREFAIVILAGDVIC